MTEAERDIQEVVRRELGKEAHGFEKLKGGRNSQVFRVDCEDGAVFAAKAYFQSENDRRDRIGNEFRALRYLKSEGFAQVPEPLAADAARRVGIYEYVEGSQVVAPGETDIDQAVEFLGALKAAAAAGGDFPPASEACFSIEAIIGNLGRRFGRLEDAAGRHPELGAFLNDHLAPFRQTAEKWARSQGVDPDTDIPLAARTLSPSDFGFHNALRKADGKLVFLDFEYFGWDDPAKTLSDFLLHPAMELPQNLRERFLPAALRAFADPGLGARVRAVYPLFGLKWCAILLNEFTLEHMERRCFADGAPGAWSGAVQLEKARRMLAGVMHDYLDSPIHP